MQKDRVKAIEFANSLRGKYLLSQALNMGIKHLKKLEERKDKFPKRREHAQPSNRKDMEYLQKNVFSLYSLVHDELNNVK